MPRKPNNATTDIWVLLNIAHKRVTQRFESELRRNALPPPAWYDILWGLERAPDGLRQFELEAVSLFDQPNLSRTLKRMVDEGLVSQVPAPEDRRGRILAITGEGKSLRAKMWDIYGQLMLTEIEEKVPAELAQGLIDGLQALVPDFEQI